MLPGTEQRNRICPISISRVETPNPPIRTFAALAVVQLITVIENGDAPTLDVDHEKADEHLVLGLGPGLSHVASTEHRLSQNLRNLTCRE